MFAHLNDMTIEILHYQVFIATTKAISIELNENLAGFIFNR
jgi:hypothetical protein